MTPEEQRRIATERKRNYRQRKRSEELARQAITPTDTPNMHELEEAWKNAESDPHLYPMPEQDHREQAQAIVSDAEERHRRVELIMANYKKEAANGNALLWHILETLTLMRLELTDLLGGKK